MGVSSAEVHSCGTEGCRSRVSASGLGAGRTDARCNLEHGVWRHRGKRDEAWHWLLDKLKPDIALLQECVVPDWANTQCDVLFEQAAQKWGTAVVTRGLPMTRHPLEDIEEWFRRLGPEAPKRCAAARLKGWCVPASLTLPDGTSALVISLHNPAYSIKRELLAGHDVTNIKLKLQRNVWLLDVVFHFLKSRVDRPLIVGGDFNSSRLFDVPKPRGNAEFFDRIATEGFASLHRLFYQQDETTFFSKRARPHQLDYLYTDHSLASRTTNCWVVSRQEVEMFSDHSPVVADLALTAA